MNRHSQIPFCTLVNLSPPLPRRLLLRPDGAVPPRWRLPSPMPRGWEERERLVPLLEPVRLERPCPHPARGSCRSWQPARVLRDATWPPGQAAGHDRPHHVEEGRPLREVGLGECLAQEPRRAPGGHVPRPARSGSRGGFAHGAARGAANPSELALSLPRILPETLLRFSPLVLADAGFGNDAFLEGVKRLGLDVVLSIRRNRRLTDGCAIAQARSGEHVTPTGLPFPVTVARHHLPRDGRRETRFVVATFAVKGRAISNWGRQRWRIEAFSRPLRTASGPPGPSRAPTRALTASCSSHS